MSKYYTAKRTSNLYRPGEPFRISRAKIDLFMKCPRCFYLDRRLGVAQPPGFPFSLNSAVDKLLKKEFDVYRERCEPHPLFKTWGVELIPFKHSKLEEWRDSLRAGITYTDSDTKITLTGGIDDIWINRSSILHIADYKSTAKDGEVTLDAEWQISYKRQMEIYQWLFRKNGFPVSPIGYFLYCNGKTDRPEFGARLDFDLKLIPYHGDDSWVEETIKMAYVCLMMERLPKAGQDCDFCKYRVAAGTEEKITY